MRVVSLMIVFAAVSVVGAADPASELKALAGTWEVKTAEIDGKNVYDSFKSIVLNLTGDKYTVTIGDLSDKGTVTVDPSKTPKTMDVIGVEGANRGKTYPCVYELKEDTLTVCYGLDFKTRPKELKTEKDSQRMLITYKRKK